MAVPVGPARKPQYALALTRHNNYDLSNHQLQRSCAIRGTCFCLYIKLILVRFGSVRFSLLPFLVRSFLYSAPTQRCRARPSSVHLSRPLRHLLIPAARLKTRLEQPHHHPPFSLHLPTMNTKCNLSTTRSDISGLAAPSGDTPVCLVL
jgi:hypothetical protein